jgi:hypothetical protein
MHQCKYCNKEFNSGPILGAHTTCCTSNPKFSDILKKKLETRNNRWKTFDVNCGICNTLFSIEEYNVDLPKKSKYYCSRKCANTRSHSNETKNKIAEKLKKPKMEYFCVNCGKQKSKKGKTDLCSPCLYSSKKFSDDISKRMKGKNKGDKNGMFGKTPKHTKNITVFTEKSSIKNFVVRSTYEKLYIDKLNNDKFVSRFEYEPSLYKVKYMDDNGTNKTYQPDFLVGGKIIEIKNKWNATHIETKIKKDAFEKQFPEIEYVILIYDAKLKLFTEHIIY